MVLETLLTNDGAQGSAERFFQYHWRIYLLIVSSRTLPIVYQHHYKDTTEY